MRRRWGAELAGAVMLGVGTIFQGKARADDHWSTSPRQEQLVTGERDDAGDPPTGADLDGVVPTGTPPPPPRRRARRWWRRR